MNDDAAMSAVDAIDDGDRPKIPWQANQAVESWRRVLAKTAANYVPTQFRRASIELLRLAKLQPPQGRQAIVDALHDMATVAGIDADAAQQIMAEAAEAPPDVRPKIDGQAITLLPRGEKPHPPASPNDLDTSGALDPLSEECIALAFAERHAADLRYVAQWNRWLTYNGSRWQPDSTLLAFDRARSICREISVDHKSKAVASAKTVAAVERLAKADRRLSTAVEQWDADPWLFNAKAATFDLRNGEARRPDADDYITKQATCACAAPGAEHPLWTAFLDRVTDGNDALQEFLQRYIGYCCTGDTKEHKFVFAYGTGGNGKGTFINTVAKIFGDYATVADMATFIASNTERHPTDLAKLNGARLVVAQETQKGRRWDENRIKALTGGDKITARFMRQDFFDFTPTFKLFICGNHKPRLNSVDEAMRRRLLLVPFTVQIPPAERDLVLQDKLEPEYPAILRWCIDGCLEWQRIGLNPPAIVSEATDAYFSEQDSLQQWLDECTVVDGGNFISLAELFASWKMWCEKQNLPPGSTRSLSDALTDRGFDKKRYTTQRGFIGLALKIANA